MNKQNWTGTLLVVTRIVLGAVFIFSSFVKGVDPLGSAYKFSDYFMAFHLDFLNFFTLPLAFILSATEFLIGISLLLKLKFRIGAWAVLVFMSFFTLLTLILALTNPVSDCGCFGDAIIMTNWQTFFKNTFLLPFVFIVFRFRTRKPDSFDGLYAWTGLLVFTLFFLGMEWHGYRHLPFLDFRPYSVGTSIPEKMIIPEGAQPDVFQTILYYEKDGEVREFTEDNFPWQDTTWVFVDTRHQLVSKGYEPPIHDFTITDTYGNDITSGVLSYPGFSFLFISTHLEKADEATLVYMNEMKGYCDALGHSFYCLTASGDAAIEKVKQDVGLGFDVHTTDEITLKTIVRANPGLLLLQEGTILGKWHHNDFPPLQEISTRTLSEALTFHRQRLEKRIWITTFLVLLTVIMGLFLVFPRNRST